jgi:hypothetical protein
MKKPPTAIHRYVVGVGPLNDGPNDDLTLALALLDGYVEVRGDDANTRHLEDDFDARLALARLLASDEPLSGRVRNQLARLFMPTLRAEGRATIYPDERVLTFAFRKKPHDYQRDGRIVRRVLKKLFVWDPHKPMTRIKGASVEAAIAEVAGEVGYLTEHAVKKIWDRHGGLERWAGVGTKR